MGHFVLRRVSTPRGHGWDRLHGDPVSLEQARDWYEKGRRLVPDARFRIVEVVVVEEGPSPLDPPPARA